MVHIQKQLVAWPQNFKLHLILYPQMFTLFFGQGNQTS